MANSRIPGPIGLVEATLLIDDKSIACGGYLQPPGPIGVGNHSCPEGFGKWLVCTFNYLSWEQIKQDMEKHESLIQHMYLDSVNKVTVGIGNMLPTLSAAQALGFVQRKGGKAASKGQIKTDWDNVNAEKSKNYRATYFARVTQLDLPLAACWELLKKRIDDEFIPALKTIFNDWDFFPVPAKRALLDMIYNLGPAGFKKFKNLIAHVEKNEWDKAADECSRRGISKERNEWTAARFREAALAK